MIDPNTIHTLSNLNCKGIAVVLANSGYAGCAFKHAAFLGINEDGHFAYKVTYYDDAGTGEEDTGNVYLIYNHATDSFKADF